MRRFRYPVQKQVDQEPCGSAKWCEDTYQERLRFEDLSTWWAGREPSEAFGYAEGLRFDAVSGCGEVEEEGVEMRLCTGKNLAVGGEGEGGAKGRKGCGEG